MSKLTFFSTILSGSTPPRVPVPTNWSVDEADPGTDDSLVTRLKIKTEAGMNVMGPNSEAMLKQFA